MTEIKPFKGLHYNTEKAGPLSTLVAPPYDIVDKKQRDQLVSANPNNIFAVELPDPSMCSDTDDAYRCADSIFSSWISQGIMVEDRQPEFYAYDIDFSANSKNFRRKGFIALVRLSDWAEKKILPHEKTFDKVTRDRLSLTQAARAQFSPIFMLYRHSHKVAELLASAQGTEEQKVIDPAGNTHRVQAMISDSSNKAIQEALADSPLYIADGHHRYTTALKYRDIMRSRFSGPDADAMPFNYIMTYLVDAEDPGLIVLPTHRIVRMEGETDWEGLRTRAGEIFNITRVCSTQDRGHEDVSAAIEQELSAYDGHLAIGVIAGDDAEIWRLKKEKESAAYSSSIPEPLRQLDVVLLDHVILRNILGFDSEAEERNVTFSANPVDAMNHMDKDQMMFFMRPTPVHQVLDIADQGLTMPHKSTFFYPKILTGMVVNSLR